MCQLWTISPPCGRDATVYLRNGRAGQRAEKQTDDRASFSALVGSQLPIFSFFLFPRVERFPLPVLLVLRGIKKTKCATQRAARSWAGSQCRGARRDGALVEGRCCISCRPLPPRQGSGSVAETLLGPGRWRSPFALPSG